MIIFFFIFNFLRHQLNKLLICYFNNIVLCFWPKLKTFQYSESYTYVIIFVARCCQLIMIFVIVYLILSSWIHGLSFRHFYKWWKGWLTIEWKKMQEIKWNRSYHSHIWLFNMFNEKGKTIYLILSFTPQFERITNRNFKWQETDKMSQHYHYTRSFKIIFKHTFNKISHSLTYDSLHCLPSKHSQALLLLFLFFTYATWVDE